MTHAHSPVEPEEIAPSQHQAARGTFAAAFLDDPMFTWLIPNAGKRQRYLEAIMAASLPMIRPQQEVRCLPGDDVPGILSLLGPGRFPLPWTARLGFMLRLLPQVLQGMPSPKRLGAVLSAEEIMNRVHIRRPHLYLYILAIHPSHQGKGLGGQAIRYAIGRAERERLPVYLETTKSANLDFYRRFGFQLLDIIQKGETPPIFTMMRPEGE